MDSVCLIASGACFVAGTVVGLLAQWGYHLRLLRLEFHQADLELEVLTEKRKRAINTRWQGNTTEDLLAQLTKVSKVPHRYANDPQGDDGLPG